MNSKKDEQSNNPVPPVLVSIPKWLAKKKNLPMHFIGVIPKQSPKAYYIIGKGVLLKKAMGICSICGATLSNPNSIKLGIGPICAENMGIPLLSGYTDKDIEKHLHGINIKDWFPMSYTKISTDLTGINTPNFNDIQKQISTYQENKEYRKIDIKGNTIYIYFSFDKELLFQVKTIKGRKFSKVPKPHWECPDTPRNRTDLISFGFDLPDSLPGALTENKDKVKEGTQNGKRKPVPIHKPIPEHLDKVLMPFQKEGVKFIFQKHGRALIGDEMGCIAGDAIINYNRGGASRTITLEKLHNRLNKPGRYSWDKSIPTFIRSLKGDHFGLHELKKVLYKGKKETIKITTKSGKQITLTPDHELLNDKNKWIRAQELQIGDYILVNGTVCKRCNKPKDDIITYKYAKFKGYCKNCMYKRLRENHHQVYNKKRKGSEGYIYLKGKRYRKHPRYLTGGLAQHIYLMEKHLQRALKKGEEVHHINGIRDDNRIENLQILSISEHRKIHNCYLHFNNSKTKSGNELIIIPKKEKVSKIQKTGVKKVYDIVMNDPYRNFVGNGIIVHNCGKTLQALTYMEMKSETCIVICPASLKLTWAGEIAKWCTDYTIYLCQGKKKKEKVRLVQKGEPKKDIYICNWDIIGNKTTKDKGEKYPKDIPYTGWVDYLIDLEPDLVIGDEVHFAKNHKAIRARGFKRIGQRVKHLIGLSGTPIENRPVEFFPTLNLLNAGLFNNWWKYTQKYCGAQVNHFGRDVSGASNIEELHSLVSNVMIRRLKKDVLPELPLKVRSVIPLQLSNEKTYQRAHNDFIDYLLETKGTEAADKAAKAEHLVKIENLKQLSYQGKKKAVIEWIKDYLETENKLVVFGIHKTVIQDLYNAFKDVSVIIDGTVPVNERQAIADRFQTDPNIKLFIGNIKAASEGLTLHASKATAFVEYWWTPGKQDQAEDRVHRIGQTADSVTAYYLAAKNSIDEDMLEMLDVKRKIVNGVLDGGKEEEVSLMDIMYQKHNVIKNKEKVR